ncbi:MAG: PaaI family thioesterase, partial [Solirubrobacterales bacterium]|nr:PaaI family thioesterase [Solirubrobacterales bacterium]
MRTLGAELTTVCAGRVEIELASAAALTQQDGYLHAGAVISVLDSACGYAAYSLMPKGRRVLTVELKVNLLAPAAGQLLIATGQVLRPGRTLTICRGEGHVDGRHVATLLTTMMGSDET